MSAPRCTATTKAGERCRQYSTVNDSGMCVIHDPARKAEIKSIRARGGKTTAKNSRRVLSIRDAPDQPKTAADRLELAHHVVWAMLVGKVDPTTGGAVLKGLLVAKAMSEDSEVSDRLAELEATLAEVKRTGMRAS